MEGKREKGHIRQSSLLTFFQVRENCTASSGRSEAGQPPTPTRKRESDTTQPKGGDACQGPCLAKRPKTWVERGWREVEVRPDDQGRRCVMYEDGEGSRLRYWPSFLSSDQATQLYIHLRDTTEWSQGGSTSSSSSSSTSSSASTPSDHDREPNPEKPTTKDGEWMRGRARYVNTHGKLVSTPRLQKHYGRGIAGGSKFRCGFRAWPTELLQIKTRVEEAAGQPFNFLLLNFYRDEKDHMSVHTDAGPFLGTNPVIASLSVGAVRRFVLNHTDKAAKPAVPRFELNLAHGSLLVMEGATQHRWLHSVPKLRAITGGRINLTFRFILDQYGADEIDSRPNCTSGAELPAE